MVDPKRVELSLYDGIPHLMAPVVTDSTKAPSYLKWALREVDKRYKKLADVGVRNIDSYNKYMDENPDAIGKLAAEDNLIHAKMPYIMIIIDELADLMMVSSSEVEASITRLAQIARAAGIHMIVATQRPSVDVITGLIKANIPGRIAFSVASLMDSRTILDSLGAEKLLGRGDMLFMEPGATHIIRGQCSFVQDSEIKDIVKFINSQAEPQYIEQAVLKQESKTFGAEQEKDELYREAVEMVLDTKQASASMIQRKFRVGYTRAARMIDIMEEEGIIGRHNGSKAREILINSIDEIEESEE